MKRRDIGFALAGLGGFLVVVALLLPTYVVGQIVKFPLNEYETATLDASNATYFSPSKLTEETGVSMQALYTIKGEVGQGTSSTAVWQEFAVSNDLTNHVQVQIQSRTLAFNRKTAQLVNCCGANVNGNSSVDQRGVAGYVFPMGDQKQTYYVFDTTLNKPMPFVYSGTSNVDGIQTYVYIENVAPTQFATETVPGSLIGTSAASVTLPEYYSMRQIDYVDPETGALVNVNEHQTLSLHNPSTGAQALLLYDADLIATPATVHSIVGLDSSGRNELSLLKTILPLVLGILGLILVIGGLLMTRRGPREDVEAAPTGSAPELAAVPAEAATAEAAHEEAAVHEEAVAHEEVTAPPEAAAAQEAVAASPEDGPAAESAPEPAEASDARTPTLSSPVAADAAPVEAANAEEPTEATPTGAAAANGEAPAAAAPRRARRSGGSHAKPSGGSAK
jgi:hypothetical protein